MTRKEMRDKITALEARVTSLETQFRLHCDTSHRESAVYYDANTTTTSGTSMYPMTLTYQYPTGGSW